MKTKTKIIIASLIGSLGILTMLNLYINETGKQDVVVIDNTTKNQIEGQNNNITTTTSTIATTKKKTTKKVVKTTKKTTKKVSTMNVKYSSKNEIIEYAHNEVLKKWGAGHWEAFYNIVAHESGWNPNNVNKSSGACGLFQFVPCSKGGNAYKTDYKVQVQKGIQYIEYRYGTPNKAWKFWQEHHWY